MNVTKYKAKSNFTVLDTLFLKGDVLYATGSIYVMNGKFDYAHKIFDADKKYLGMVRREDFPEKNIEPAD